MSAKRESSKCSEEDKELPPDHHQPQVKKLKSSEPDLTDLSWCREQTFLLSLGDLGELQ